MNYGVTPDFSLVDSLENSSLTLALTPGFAPVVDTGDQLGDLTGVVNYSYGNFEVLPVQTFTPISTGLLPESTLLVGSPGQLTIAGYNVLNLDPNDSDGDMDIADGRFTQIALQIAGNLGSPHIVALQEVQDNSGSTSDGTVDASLTCQTLISEILAQGPGAGYSWYDIPPLDGQDGGQPGGNIRCGYLYDPAVVNLVGGERIVDPDLGGVDQ